MLKKYLQLFKGNETRLAAASAARGSDLDDDATPDIAWQPFLGRQPILDDGYRIAGYELTIKSGAPLAVDTTGRALQQMRDEMLVVSVIDLAFQKALGNKLTFISLSPAMLEHPLLEQLPAKNVVVAIRAPASPEALAARCRDLSERGIQIALEDFTYGPEIEPLLELCRYVRIDTSRRDALQLREEAAGILELHAPLLMATEVETEEAFEAYRALSFGLFQGYHFTRLQPGMPHRIDSNRMHVTELLNMVTGHAEIPALEAKVKLDPALSYRLLNYINSPANGLRQKITSIGHALVLLGYDQLYRWLTLLMFTSGQPDERNRTLLRNALVRGRFCETLGQSRFAAAELGGLFIAGIFSLLDALLNAPMEQALGRLNLPEAVTGALLRQEGSYAPYLQLAIACEHADHATIARHCAACGLDAEAVNAAHVNALVWAEQVEA